MRNKNVFFLVALFFCATSLYAQFGIKAGINMANEIRSFSQADVTAGFNSKNLTGYQIGLVYQAMPKGSGLGCEIGAMLSQKGSAFTQNTDIPKGYNELKYLEVPLNLRYRLTLGIVGVYGTAGIYGGYALSGKTVNEVTDEIHTQTFQGFVNHFDYGYNLGAGVELFKKIQFGATWSNGLKNTDTILPTQTAAKNRVFSINLVYVL